VETLEDRVLFSADILPASVLEVPESTEVRPDVFPAWADSVRSGADSSEGLAEKHGLEQSSISPNPTQLIVIDSGIANHAKLIADLELHHGHDAEVLLLDKTRDGIQQIANALATDNRNISSLHIISHGNESELRLGSSVVNASSLNQFATQIASWQQGLVEDSDILIYGCELAGNSSGEALVEAISGLTAANIAASDDLTGHKDLGGDWELEYTVGQVDTDVVFSPALQASYTDTFAVVSVTTLNDVVDLFDNYTNR